MTGTPETSGSTPPGEFDEADHALGHMIEGYFGAHGHLISDIGPGQLWEIRGEAEVIDIIGDIAIVREPGAQPHQVWEEEHALMSAVDSYLGENPSQVKPLSRFESIKLTNKRVIQLPAVGVILIRQMPAEVTRTDPDQA